MPESDSSRDFRDFTLRRLPWLTAAGALVLYLVTLNGWLTPGSLVVTAQVNGWEWQPQLFQPVQWLVTLPLRLLPEAHVPLALNLLAAVLAAAVVGLLTRSAALLPQDRLPMQRDRLRSAGGLLTGRWAWLPPLVAAMAVALQLSFWQHGIAGTGEMLNLFLFAWGVRCLLEYRVDEEAEHWLMQAALAYGLGVANAWTFVGYGPLLLAAVVWLGGKRLLEWRPWWKMLLAGAAGMLLIALLPAWQSLVGASEVGFWRALRHVTGSYRGMVMTIVMGFRANPHLALIVASTTFIPVFFLALRWRRHVGETGWLGEVITRGLTYLAHGLMLAGCLWAVFDLPFSPRQAVARLGLAPPLLSCIYLACLALAYYVGFFLVLSLKPQTGSRRQAASARWMQTLFRSAMVLLAAGIPVALLVKNLSAIRAFNAPVYREYARLLAARLPQGDAYVLSDDLVRLALLRAALAEQPQPGLVLIDARALPFLEYWKHLHRTYGDAWPEQPPGVVLTEATRKERIEPATVLRTLRTLAESRPAYYLTPGFGSFFDTFYQDPAGLFYALTTYPGGVLNPPALPAGAVAANQTFWRSNAIPLRELLTGQQQQHAGENSPATRRLRDRLWSTEPMPLQTAQTASWVSSALDAFGVRLQRDGDPTGARWYFDEARKVYPGSVSAEVNQEANAFLLKSEPVPLIPVERVKDRFGVRRDWSLVMRESGPFDHPTLCYELGSAFAAAGFLRQSALEFDRARQLAPSYLPAWVRFGACLNALKLTEHALQVVREAHRAPALRATLATNSMDLAVVEAEALWSKDDRALALAVLRDARQQAGNTAEVLLRVSDFHARHQQWTDALAFARQAQQASPELARAAVQVGYLELKTGALSNAVATLTAALELKDIESQRTVALLNRAVSLLRLGDFARAESDYRQLLTLTPSAFPVYYGLGEIALRRGDTNAAIEWYRGYLTNAAPEAEETLAVRTRLQTLEAGRK